MKILFDNSTPKPIAECLKTHEVYFARQIGWHQLTNGELISKAQEAGYDVLLTTDRNLYDQQTIRLEKSRLLSLATNNGRTCDYISIVLLQRSIAQFQGVTLK